MSFLPKALVYFGLYPLSVYSVISFVRNIKWVDKNWSDPRSIKVFGMAMISAVLAISCLVSGTVLLDE
jgi:hypothetical protein